MSPLQRRATAFCIITAVLCAVLPASVRANDMADFIGQAADQGRAMYGWVREVSRKAGLRDLESLAHAVQFDVDAVNPLPSAAALVLRGGSRKIVVSAQLILSFYYFSELSILNLHSRGKWQNCIALYSAYLREEYGDIASGLLRGSKPAFLKPPEKYALVQGGGCDGLNRAYPFPEAEKQRRHVSVSNAIAFVLLHELAHHHYRHVEVPVDDLDLRRPEHMRRYLQAMCRSREQERQADMFATNVLVDLGAWQAVTDQTLWMSMLAVGSLDPDLERGSGHDSPVRRQTAAMTAARARLAARGTPMPPDLSAAIDELVAFNQKVDRSLPLTPIKGAEGIRCG